MVTLYITSPETYSGKSALCLGLGRRFQRDGFVVGYMKPASTAAKRISGHLTDDDAEFVKRMFNLSESLDVLVPICLDPLCVEAALRGEGNSYSRKLKEAFGIASQGKDIMILEGGSSLAEGYVLGLPAYEISQLLDARELLVVKYTSDLVVDNILASKKMLGDSMIGCVLNTVPGKRLEFVEGVVVPFLEQKGIPVFGILPQERLLQAVSVHELAEALDGEILCAESHADELVENVMVGAMSVDSALSFFRRKVNKAVITGGDRPDIQLAALETSTKCLILTGNLQPSPIILNRAEELGVPMLLVKQDTWTAMQTVEQFFGKSRLRQPKKLARLEQILADRFNFAALYQALGIQPRN